MPRKVCFKCKKTKSVEDFYRHEKMGDGRLGKCIDCAKKDVREHRLAHPERLSQYEKQRNRTAARKKKRVEYQAKERRLNPVKYKARQITAHAIASGRLVRQPCVHCGEKKVEAHHPDYSKPLDVVWVCFFCHRTHEHKQVVTANLSRDGHGKAETDEGRQHDLGRPRPGRADGHIPRRE